jgi:hypothetical protein
VLGGVPRGAGPLIENATRQGFLSGLNAILIIGALIAFAGALLAVWLVREDEIEREQPQAIAAGAAELEMAAA